jgi:hypothetical protein
VHPRAGGGFGLHLPFFVFVFCEYRERVAGSFTYGLAPVGFGDNNYAWIDTNGKVVIRFSEPRPPRDPR